MFKNFMQNFNRCNKIGRFINVYNRIKYFLLFDYGWYDEIWNNIKNLISEKKWYYR